LFSITSINIDNFQYCITKAVINPLKFEDTFWNLKDKNGEAIRQMFINNQF
ncbi:3996_t:CDS:2, partial [Scutellospora calospora]